MRGDIITIYERSVAWNSTGVRGLRDVGTLITYEHKQYVVTEHGYADGVDGRPGRRFMKAREA